MSNDVVIKKSDWESVKRELVYWQQNAPTQEDRFRIDIVIDRLRAAPETVSLDGVESIVRKHLNLMPVNFDRIEEAHNLASDLRRLVSPVQPSAVVSREAIATALCANCWTVGTYEKDASRIAVHGDKGRVVDAIYALQLRRLVAPVQPSAVVSREGVVELMRKVYAIDGVSVEMAAQVAKIYIDSLATFPVAPVKEDDHE